MHLTKRQKIGAALMVTSIVVAILIQIFTRRLLDVQVEHAGGELTGPGYWKADITTYHFHWKYAVPLAAGFIFGLACLLWPSAKPPKIIS